MRLTAVPGFLMTFALWLVGCTAGQDRDDSSTPPAETTNAPPGTAAEWQRIKQDIRSNFPDVTQLTIAEYRSRAADASPAPLLVDVRPDAEWDVSHLPGARHIPAGAEFVRGFEGVARDREIVLYCSVGWRSSEAAQLLMDAGFTNVENLEGSIFEWANAGYELETESGSADRVHPYSKRWGRLLRSDRREPL